MRYFLLIIYFCFGVAEAGERSSVLGAGDAFVLTVDAEQNTTYMAPIAHIDDLRLFLAKAEGLIDSAMVQQSFSPIQFVLHGDEIGYFDRQTYMQNKALVDQAARLEAFGVIDIKACERWMNENEFDKTRLPAFMDTIPFAPREVRRLEGEGYLVF